MEPSPEIVSNSFGRKATLVFFGILALLLIWMYAPMRFAGFVTDFWGWQKEYGACSIWELWQCADIKSLQHFQHLMVATFYKLFGISGWAWTFASVGLLLIFLWNLLRFWQRVFEYSSQTLSFSSAWTVILLIAVVPYNTEVMVWRVCLHYMLAGIFLLSSSYYWLEYLSNGRMRSLWFGTGLFALALGTLELSLVYPLFLLPVAWYIFKINSAHQEGFRNRLIRLSGLSLLLIFGFFLMSKLVLGVWIGHYGAETHAGLKINEFAVHYYQYFVKHLALIRFLPHHIKTSIFELFSVGYFYLYILLLIFGSSFLMLRSALRKHFVPEWIGLWGFFVFLLPVGNLFFVHLLLNENDRYGFIPAAFLLSSLVFFISRFRKKLKYAVLSIIILLNGFYLFKMRSIWTANGKVYQALVSDFRWYESDFIFVLNIPDNFEGTPMFRVLNTDSGLEQSLIHTRRQPFSGKITEVALYNMIHETDGVTAMWIDEQTIHVEMHEWGGWWWKKGQGLADHSSELYDFRLEGKGYKLTMKSIPVNSVFIYQDGSQWKELTR